jgi:hypothetical protein
MFKVIQRFGKQYSCHLQVEYVLVGEWNVANLIGGA